MSCEFTVSVSEQKENLQPKSPIVIFPGFLETEQTLDKLTNDLKAFGHPLFVVKHTIPTVQERLHNFLGREELREKRRDEALQLLASLRSQGYTKVHLLAHSAGAVTLADALTATFASQDAYPTVTKVALVSPACVSGKLSTSTLVSRFSLESLNAARHPASRAYFRKHTPLRHLAQHPWYHAVLVDILSHVSLQENIQNFSNQGIRVGIFGAEKDMLFPPTALQDAAKEIGGDFFLLPGNHNTLQSNPTTDYFTAVTQFFE